MGTPYIGLAVAPRDRNVVYPKTINTAGMLEGAAVIYDVGNGVKAPGAALARGFAGCIADVTPPGGTIAGTDINLQRSKVGQAILAPGFTVANGTQLVINDVNGWLRPYVHGTDANCEIVAESESTLTTGASPAAISVNFDAFAYVP